MLLIVFFCLAAIEQAASLQETLIVDTSQGPVKGYKDLDHDIYVFYGIPYAKAPTGAHKFKAPLPAPTWSQPFEAVEGGIVCPQTQYIPYVNKTMQEDCLIANIYVPATDQKLLSVVVIVHGGVFLIGSGDVMSPMNLLESKQVIALTFNYRLGVHGFLCLGTEDVPGNAGMKDMVALLRWVRENIVNFGGNPEDVTLYGYSAGGAAVDLLQFSESAQGLFHKVIPEGGVNAVWSVQIDPLMNARNFASRFNVNDDALLEDFYKTASYKTLTENLFTFETNSRSYFVPCVERKKGPGSFLTDSPVSILMSGKFAKVPVLYGITDKEGLLKMGYYEIWKNVMNKNFSAFIPVDLQINNDKEKEEIAATIKSLYFGNEKVDDDTIMGYIDFFTDIIFAYPVRRAVKFTVNAGSNSIYLYDFSFTDQNDPIFPHTKDVRGAYHLAPTYEILGAPTSDLKLPFSLIPTDKRKALQDYMRKIWINFITTGNPVSVDMDIQWPAVDANGVPYMMLDETPKLVTSPLLDKRMRFWEELYAKYYRHPAPPDVL